ncbi:MAG: toxin-antitoxin system YwqK family antitoxin [Cetobacterium sp.]
MKKKIMSLFILSNIISYSLQLNEEDLKIIKKSGFKIINSKDNQLFLSNDKVYIKFDTGKLSLDYINLLKVKEGYQTLETSSENGNTIYSFYNTAKNEYHTIINTKENNIQMNFELIVPKDYNQNLEIEQIINLYEQKADFNSFKNHKYIGLTQEIESPSKSIDDLNKQSKKEKEETKFFENPLKKIKNYKAQKIPMFLEEIPFSTVTKQGDFLYNITTGELITGIITIRGQNNIIYLQQEAKKGLYDGKYEIYYPNFSDERMPEVIGKYIKGEKEGTWKIYYENGNLKSVAKYDNGVLIGKFKSYYMNKELEVEGEYKNGKKEGEWIYYYQNGEQESSGKYENDKKIKKWKYFNTNGKLREEKKHSFTLF